MIPDFFILVVGAMFLVLTAFQFYVLFKVQDLDKTVADIAKIVLGLKKKPDEKENL